ncbi:extensin-2-like [Solenopsis invicta]|uniref:extensin-2-like n=1 Tax=Solenopsis invicta TaxID=13686 RepID=UPI00193C8A95|nr:extensin-2-like [Solenopsis invicta]
MTGRIPIAQGTDSTPPITYRPIPKVFPLVRIFPDSPVSLSPPGTPIPVVYDPVEDQLPADSPSVGARDLEEEEETFSTPSILGSHDLEDENRSPSPALSVEFVEELPPLPPRCYFAPGPLQSLESVLSFLFSHLPDPLNSLINYRLVGKIHIPRKSRPHRHRPNRLREYFRRQVVILECLWAILRIREWELRPEPAPGWAPSLEIPPVIQEERHPPSPSPSSPSPAPSISSLLTYRIAPDTPPYSPILEDPVDLLSPSYSPVPEDLSDPSSPMSPAPSVEFIEEIPPPPSPVNSTSSVEFLEEIILLSDHDPEDPPPTEST